MDRSVLEGDPHSVIEGMIIAGYAIGAEAGYTLFRDLGLHNGSVPDVATLNWATVTLAAISALALFRLHLSLAWTLALAGGLGLLWHGLL